MAETLYEAGLYFKGGASYFNSGVTYISPIQYHCQRNYVIIITDGNSTMDRNSILASVIGDQDNDGREPGGAHEVYYDSNGTDYLDDVAKYLYDNDIRSDLDGQQNIITYTIGFTISSDLLERTATHGHGRYFYSNSAQDLANAFQNIVDDILKSIHLLCGAHCSCQQDGEDDRWRQDLSGLISTRQQRDVEWEYQKIRVWLKVIRLEFIRETSLMSTETWRWIQPASSIRRRVLLDDDCDGWRRSRKGRGRGEVLLNRSTARNIYTYLGTNVESNPFFQCICLTNAAITPTLLGLGSDTTARDNLISLCKGMTPMMIMAMGSRPRNELGFWVPFFTRDPSLFIMKPVRSFSQARMTACSMPSTILMEVSYGGSFLQTS